MHKLSCLFALLLLTGATSLRAQSWTRVQALSPGTQIRIVDSSGTQLKGTLTSVTNDAISIQTGSGETAVERTRVRRVEAREGSRRLRNTLIGAGIGVAVGLVIDNSLGVYFRNEAHEGDGARALTYLVPAGVFAGIGATRATHTIYKSR